MYGKLGLIHDQEHEVTKKKKRQASQINWDLTTDKFELLRYSLISMTLFFTIGDSQSYVLV